MPADNPPVVNDEYRTISGGCGGSLGLFTGKSKVMIVWEVFIIAMIGAIIGSFAVMAVIMRDGDFK